MGFWTGVIIGVIILAGIVIVWRIRVSGRRRGRAFTAAGDHYVEHADAWGEPEVVRVIDRVEDGLDHIRGQDRDFDPERFKDFVAEAFGRFQDAWHARDLTAVKTIMTEELFELVDEDVRRMLADGVTNRLEAEEGEVDLVEAWQEDGQDFITTKLTAQMIEYTMNVTTRQVVDGDPDHPVKFEEHWTFTRPSGPGPWILGAIRRGE
ncbi:MAG: 39S ribosomal protein L45 [Proteobacteria bacterium]|nr:39S ribosomal protein L45 [Pseudomonadota bacterium]MBU1740138.1 39S ribosomal protein L45 [Pseudomonadota bacterium]